MISHREWARTHNYPNCTSATTPTPELAYAAFSSGTDASQQTHIANHLPVSPSLIRGTSIIPSQFYVSEIHSLQTRDYPRLESHPNGTNLSSPPPNSATTPCLIALLHETYDASDGSQGLDNPAPMAVHYPHTINCNQLPT